VRRLAVLMLLLSSCASEEIKEVSGARAAFEEWRKATIAGDVDKTLSMLSDSRKSEWLYDRLEENDTLARRWRGDLTGPARTDLDLWWGQAHKTGNGRDPLRSTVLNHPSFISLFREYFMQSAAAIRAQMTKLEVTSVYGDQTGVTVAVRGGSGAPTELYGMIFEHDGWKIDNYRQPLTMQR